MHVVRIGIDVTELYIVKAGIFYHRVNLLKNILEYGGQHEFVLVDYAPVRGERSLPIDIRAWESEGVRVVEITGPRQRKLIEWKRLDFFGGRFTAQRIDAVLDRPWKWFISGMTRRELNATLAELDVLHVSEVCQVAPRAAKVIATVHDASPILFPETHTPDNRARFEKKMRYVQKHADIVIAVSEHTKRDLIRVFGIPEDRIRVVYNAVDPIYAPLSDRNEIDRVIRKYGLPGSGYILFVGTLEPRKNLVRLIEAYGIATDACADQLPPLVLAGAKGWFYEEIFQCVERLGLQHRVIFTGFVDDGDMLALFNAATLFVYPSLYEGFGMPVLEAMACGLPVITSNTSSLPEVAGSAAVLVDPVDIDGLATTVMDLLDDPERRSALRSAGLARTAEFSWEQAAQETLSIYEEAAPQ